GGIFVGLIAPNVFSGYYEFALALVFCAALVASVTSRDLLKGVAWVFALIYVVGLTGYVGYELKISLGANRLAVRNFYGGLKVSDSGSGREAIRTLTHGTINHGEQFLDPVRRLMPITYYGPDSGVALAILNVNSGGPRHLGVIGLGTGTLAAY